MNENQDSEFNEESSHPITPQRKGSKQSSKRIQGAGVLESSELYPEDLLQSQENLPTESDHTPRSPQRSKFVENLLSVDYIDEENEDPDSASILDESFAVQKLNKVKTQGRIAIYNAFQNLDALQKYAKKDHSLVNDKASNANKKSLVEFMLNPANKCDNKSMFLSNYVFCCSNLDKLQD